MQVAAQFEVEDWQIARIVAAEAPFAEVREAVHGFAGSTAGSVGVDVALTTAWSELDFNSIRAQLQLSVNDLSLVMPEAQVTDSLPRNGGAWHHENLENRGAWHLENGAIQGAWHLENGVVKGGVKGQLEVFAPEMVTGRVAFGFDLDRLTPVVAEWTLNLDASDLSSLMPGGLEWSLAESTVRWESDGSAFHLYELVSTFEPIVMEYLDYLQAQPEEVPMAAQPVTSTLTTEVVQTGAQGALWIQVNASFAKVFLTEDRYFERMNLMLTHDGQSLPDVRLVADEGGRSRLDFSMHRERVKPSVHLLDLQVPDIAGLANLLVAPLDKLQLTSSMLGENLAVARRVPDSFRGGTLVLRGQYTPEDPDVLIAGSLMVEDLLMVKAPCLLRLVAGVSGKSFIEGVVFRRFSLDSFAVGTLIARMEGLELDGAVSMKIHEGSYAFTDQVIDVKGEHALTHFHLKGPILAPEVYLDNRLTRILGSDDSDLLDW